MKKNVGIILMLTLFAALYGMGQKPLGAKNGKR